MIIFTDQSKEFLAALNNEELRPTSNLHLSRRDDTAQPATCTSVVAMTLRSSAQHQLPHTSKFFMSAGADCSYQSTNIGLTLINVTLKRVCTPNEENMKWNQDCSTGCNLTQRLSDFSKWRGTVSDQADLWHLVTSVGASNAGWTGSAVGLVSVTSVYTTSSKIQTDGGVTTYSSGTGFKPVVFQTLVPSMNFYFQTLVQFTTATPTCALSRRVVSAPAQTVTCFLSLPVMHPSDNAESNEFSPCSIRYIFSNYTRLAKCLKNSNEITAINAGVCGNGIKEYGEDCDCGTPEECAKDSCRNGNACKFKNGAVCSDSNDECCSDASSCLGTNATCPVDLVMKDGTTCTDSFGGNVCASGYCTSRNSQCLNSLFGTVSQCEGSELQCTLHCKSSDGTCLNLNQNYIDGTPCGYGFGGSCRDGVCETGSGAGTSKYITMTVFAFQSTRRDLQPLPILPELIAIVVIIALLVFSLILLINPLRGGKSESMLKTPFFQKSHPTGDDDSDLRAHEMAKVNSERTNVATDNGGRRTPPQQQQPVRTNSPAQQQRQQNNCLPYNAPAFDDGVGLGV
ncbi:hypothetical protein BJ742DRAFT_854302 [Cladochytrium replicatum]|nr:hypothetical protein BJ742DRAFT_854302 [Cladochytrium replicatum]